MLERLKTDSVKEILTVTIAILISDTVMTFEGKLDMGPGEWFLTAVLIAWLVSPITKYKWKRVRRYRKVYY